MRLIQIRDNIWVNEDRIVLVRQAKTYKWYEVCVTYVGETENDYVVQDTCVDNFRSWLESKRWEVSSND